MPFPIYTHQLKNSCDFGPFVHYLSWVMIDLNDNLQCRLNDNMLLSDHGEFLSRGNADLTGITSNYTESQKLGVGESL